MQETLQATLKRLWDNPGMCFYKWTCVTSPGHMHARLDRVYLNVVYSDESREERFCRILGYREKAGTNDEKVVFSPDLVRVTNGARRGRLLLPEQLSEKETWKPTGVSKELSEGDQPWTFSKRRAGDRQIIELLEELRKRKKFNNTVGIAYPVFYLVTSERSRDVQLRNDQKTLKRLRSVDGYDPLLSPSQNMYKLADQLAKALPNNKLAWPFSMFCRAGVVVADPATMFDWTMTDVKYLKENIGVGK